MLGNKGKCHNPHPTAKAFFDAFDEKPLLPTRVVASSFVSRQIQSLGWRSRYSQAQEYPVSVRNNSFTVQQIQRGEIEGTYGTGATVWPASIVLVKYLELHPEKLQDRTVIDLGAGTGVTSLAAAILGAKRVVCTDGVDTVVKLARSNVSKACIQLEENDCKGKFDSIEVQEYFWGSGCIPDKFDTILVADCVLPKLYPIAPLVDALDELMKPDAIAILSYEHRHFPDYHPGQKFKELAQSKGMILKKITAADQDPVYSVEDIEIWEVRKI
mmetsp:Transcript_22041/g.32564  ORF Transcript_22041/g.32564 Transcript_22041/m.32564 type:complete len:271 (+) Transcript_22041:364-1176(+)